MAIELASVAPIQPKPGAARAPGREAPTEGEDSFASALSASNAAPAHKAAPAPARSAVKTPEAKESVQGQGQGQGKGQDKATDIDNGSALEKGVETGAKAGEDAAAAGTASATSAPAVEPAAIGLPPQPAQPLPDPVAGQTPSLPLPAESAMLLAQSAQSAPAGTPVRDANPRAAAVTAAVAQPAATLPVAAPSSRALLSTETIPVIAAEKSPPAASQPPAAVLPVVDASSPEADLALQPSSARSIGARAVPATAIRTADAEAVAAPTTPATPATSATSALAASFASTNPQQAQRAVVQAQVQALVADRAALQTPNATTALDSRAAESLAAAGLAGGASVEASASPLLRRFERVLSMTQPASGEGQAFGSGGASTASTWMTPVNGAGAAIQASMGGMTDRLVDSMNGLLAQVVAQKNHNASLTVDVGGQPVSVNVQVQGNEAQVVFRADQAETRAMLAQALPQLRQMMGAEGMVLSDASVAGQWTGGSAQAGAGGSGGSNGAGDADARRGTSPVRIDAGAPVTGAAAAATARTNGTRSLDLYV